MKSGIYIIKNTINSKVYIGSAVNLERRFSQHRNDLLKNKHGNKHLQNFVNKHGFNTLSFNILEEVKRKKDLIKREQKHIDSYNFKDLFNICKVAGSSLGTKHTAASRKKMSEILKGNTYSLGRKVLAASRKKISEFQKGNTNCIGFKHTSASRKKMSESKKGNIYSLGRKVSAATRRKLSESAIKKTVLIFKDNVLIYTAESTVAAAKKYNLHATNISRVCLGKQKTTGGYTIEYERT